MEVNNIMQFLEDRTILVTGGTGFLAKGSLSIYLSLCHSLSYSSYFVDMTFLFDITVMVEKILRVQPNVRKLYLLIRACDLEEAIKRFQMEVAGKDLFRILREKHGANIDTFLSEKVTPVAGDIANENLGLRDYNLIKEMQREVDVVVNAAATTKFYER
ncbi:putative long-chain-fatty-acyl-CoA reductase [Helianthus annuus]|nr:putative long-chain-fatty-acyl-CoA reductase [Helianthus annuus]